MKTCLPKKIDDALKLVEESTRQVVEFGLQDEVHEMTLDFVRVWETIKQSYSDPDIKAELELRINEIKNLILRKVN